MTNQPSQKEIYKLAFESDFNFFAKKFVKIVEPETDFDWNWHLVELCGVLQRQYDGLLPRNIDVNMPPRMLKSVIINVLYPCWVWAKDASKKIGSASSSYSLATKFSIKRRDLILSTAFQYFWPIQLREDQSTKMLFGNNSNGFMRALSANGKVTGDGFDIQISDDLIDAIDAFSKTVRDETKLWYSNAFYGRAQNKKTVLRINVNQRLNTDDISALLKSSYGFSRMVLEMVKTSSNESNILFNDPRKIGEYLHPARYSDSEAEEDKKQGSYVWSSQFQQSPTPIGGGIIKSEWIRYYNYNLKNSYSRKIIVADLNMKKGGDYAVFQLWGASGKDRYLIDILRGRWSYKETKEFFIQFCKKHNDVDYKFIEDKANGPALISDLKDEIRLLTAWPDPSKENKKNFKQMNKVERLYFCSSEFENGNVYFPEGNPIAKDLEIEVTSFTDKGSTTGSDDNTDALTMGLIELKESGSFFC